MKIIIVGAGKVGELLCNDLSNEGNDITLIETDSKILDKVLSYNDIMGIVGNGTDCEILKEAYIENTDIFIAVTQSDEINIISSIMAKKLGAKYTIARVRNPLYFSQMKFMSESLGIDRLLNPEAEAAFFISKNLEFPNALNVETFAKNKVTMVEFLVQKESYIDGIKLKDFKHNHFSNILVCIVQRGQEVFIPTGNFILKSGDKIYITGNPNDIQEFSKSLGNNDEKIKSVMIIGGGKITHYLIKILLEKKINVKVIEANSEKAKILSETFEDATIIHGDGTDNELLEEENFRNYDALISLTGIDEENIILSLYANKVGIKKTITKINGISLFNVLELVGLQSIITPKKIVADHIIKIVRSLISSQEENIETLYRIAENKVEAIEFKVPKTSMIINVPLKKLDIKENLLILYIIRNNKVIFPKGDDVILPEDKIIIITTEKYLNDVNKILK
ncbi:Trk system potassium transporter TrkA [Fusobacterium perfoetens]|uniref:Trk system potassium transporter TrkA n=1 Tax=Fusobacterium perfoetens TaxID=852 RepID=UPI0004845022|nr:Trk system potassium transporter TrkA [Fusobacterium perfoetens]MCI6153445.1 Trk system potassium transporter TrkA [Fusobacterium perfoetens]MDY3238412.1 Trk system potassium transporter TrkA [Fusobacterium perfoetens]